MIPVTVDQLFLSNLGFVVLLRCRDDERSVPIFIGAAEAQAIAIQLNHVEVPRPLTHDLLKHVLDFLECRLKRIEVCDIRDGTFYAQLLLEKDGRELVMDCRPSDAIALALRVGAPVFAAEKVVEEAGRDFAVEGLQQEPDKGTEPGESGSGEASKRLTPLELLERKLARAVKDERYEDAARLRDEINRLEGPHASN